MEEALRKNFALGNLENATHGIVLSLCPTLLHELSSQDSGFTVS